MLSFRFKGRWTTPSQHCQSTELSLHCSMLQMRLKDRWTPQNSVTECTDVVIQTQRQMDPPSQHSWSTEWSSSLFNVVIETQRQMCKTLPEHRVISSLFNVVIETQTDGPSSQHCESTEWSLHCSMLSFRLKSRWTPYVQNNTRAQSDLFTVQCCHSDSKADGPSSQHCQSTEWSLHCSMLSLRLKGRWTPLQHCQSTEWSLHCSMLSFRLKPRPPPVNTVRAESDLFTVQCCHWDSKADGPPPVNPVRAQSDLFTVQCCHSDSKADEPPSQHCQSTEWLLHWCCHWDSKADGPLPGQQCQSTEWSLHCSMLSFRLKGRWTPLVNTGQSTEWSLHCSMLSFRLKGRWTPQSTQSEHRFNTVRAVNTVRVISSLFNVVIETQRQMDLPLCQNTARAQSDLFTVQCCHSDSKADVKNTARAQSDLFTVQGCH